MKFGVRDLLWLATSLALAGASWVHYDRAEKLAAELKHREDRHGVEVLNAVIARDKIWWNLLDDDCRDKVAAAWNFGMPGN